LSLEKKKNCIVNNKLEARKKERKKRQNNGSKNQPITVTQFKKQQASMLEAEEASPISRGEGGKKLKEAEKTSVV